MKKLAVINIVGALILLAWFDWRIAVATVLIFVAHEISK